MNTHSLRPMFSRRNVAPFTFFFLLIIVVVFGLTHSSATAGGGSGQDNQRPQMPSDEELRKDFNDDDLKAKDDKPAGKWSYGTLLDSKQMNDPTVPAYVRSIRIVSGGGKYQGVHKIKRVRVTNKTSLTEARRPVRQRVQVPREGQGCAGRASRPLGLGRVPRRGAVIGLTKRCGGPAASRGCRPVALCLHARREGFLY
jgi:hypothetical protein